MCTNPNRYSNLGAFHCKLQFRQHNEMAPSSHPFQDPNSQDYHTNRLVKTRMEMKMKMDPSLIGRTSLSCRVKLPPNRVHRREASTHQGAQPCYYIPSEFHPCYYTSL